jgi:hypothetical protein
VDPMAELFINNSPFVYCNNNPIKFVDLYGKKPIPANQIIKKLNAVVNLATFEKAWSKSGHGKATVEEWGFIITESNDKKWYIGSNLHTDHDGGRVCRNSNVPKTEKIIGFAHTHPYSISEGLMLGAGFSDGDLSKFERKRF